MKSKRLLQLKKNGERMECIPRKDDARPYRALEMLATRNIAIVENLIPYNRKIILKKLL